MAIEVRRNEEISGGKSGGRKGVGSAICRRANREAETLQKESKEELFGEVLTPT